MLRKSNNFLMTLTVFLFLTKSVSAVLHRPIIVKEEDIRPDRFVMPIVQEYIEEDEIIGLPYYTGKEQRILNRSQFLRANNPQSLIYNFMKFKPSIPSRHHDERSDSEERDLEFRPRRTAVREGIIEIESPWESPWCIHGQLLMTIKEQAYIANGTMIGDRYVLTAGHNLFFREYKTAPELVTFYLGRHGNYSKWVGQVEAFFVHEEYCDTTISPEEAEKYDIGLIVLRDPIGREAGWIDFDSSPDEELVSKDIRITGYPANIDNGYHMYTMFGSLTEIMPEKIVYSGMKTYGGQSGSGIIGQDDVLRGVHTYGHPNSYGTRITPSIKEDLKRIMESLFSEASTSEVLSVVDYVDTRIKVENPWEFPWSIHGHMRMEIKGHTYMGGGTMIGDRYVLTSGHNIYFKDYENTTERISFFPGRHGELTAWMAEAESFYVHPRYHDEKDIGEAEKYDIGLIVLNQPLGKETGWATFDTASDELLLSEELRITGYPVDKGLGNMYTAIGPIRNVTAERLFYEIDTFGGESGAGVVNREGILRGVHTAGGDHYNIGTRITEDIKKWIITMIEHDKKSRESRV